jgi:tRNA(Met) C34 N-acetyltransferase TmcA
LHFGEEYQRVIRRGRGKSAVAGIRDLIDRIDDASRRAISTSVD